MDIPFAPSARKADGRQAVSFLRVGAVECPDVPNFIRRNREALPPPTQGSHSLRNRVRTSEERLPLEGKLAQRQLRLMRSKRSIITISWYNTATFDLIRHAKRRDTVVEV